MTNWKIWLKQNENHIIRTKPEGDRKFNIGIQTIVIWDRGFIDPIKCKGVLYLGDSVSFRAG